MKVLVTGGAGLIASHIVDRLIEAGHEVVIIDDLSTGRRENLNPRARFYQLDIRDAEGLAHVFSQERPDIVNHHAAQTDVTRSMRDPSFDAQVNILGSLNLIRCALQYGVRKIIFASTSAVYPEPEYIPADENHPIKPISAYGLSKYVVEQYLHFFYENLGLRYTAFRYGNVYGPRQDPHGESGVVAIFSEQMLTGIRPTIFGDGSKTRDYIHVDDVVAANLLAMDERGDGEVFNLGWGQEVTDFEVFDAVRKALGTEVEPLYSQKRPGELDRISLDCSKARRLLGWKPAITFAEGIPMTVEYYRRQHHKLRKEA